MAADKYILASKFAEELDTIPIELKRIGHTYKHQKLISLDSAIDLLAEAPAADVRPVERGEWERPKGSTPRSWIFVCSKCGDRAYYPVPKYFPKGCGYNFCPNCGCAMENEK